MARYFLLLFSCSLIIFIGYAQKQDSVWIIADIQTKRLSPQSFPALPQSIRNYLEQHQYSIPQDFYDTIPHNVVYGHFANKKSRDVAILCSNNRMSSIVIFWNMEIDSISEISKSTDYDWLQGIGNGRIGYSRHIFAVSKDDHDGIEDYFDGKGSEIFYFYKGQWEKLSGAD